MINKQLTRVLSKQEAIGLLEIIHAAAICHDEDMFRRIMDRLKAFIPHEHVICGLAELTASGAPGAYSVINISYPGEWIERRILRLGLQADHIVSAHFERFRVQYYDDILRETKQLRDYWSLQRDFDIGEGIFHGVRNRAGTKGSMFAFAGRRMKRSAGTEAIVDILTPHLHEALTRVLHIPGSSRMSRAPLSPKEQQVLKWMANGKSSWEISALLGISRRTVKYHAENIIKKLDASTRAHAVAIAVKQGLVDIE